MTGLNVKLLSTEAKVPTKANDFDAGYDLYAIEDVAIPPGERAVVKTGIAMEIPKGYVGLIWPRSGLSVKKGLDVLAGVIDSGYRGEIMVCLHNTSRLSGSLFPEITESETVFFTKGDKVAQILIQTVSHFDINVVEELSDSQRGEKGFGSSDESVHTSK